MAQYMADSPAVLSALATSCIRTLESRRSPLEKLPSELKLTIVRYIPEHVSIFHPALTGPEFCNLIATHEKKITIEVIRWAVPAEIMHLAVATHMISVAPWTF
ncbi:hypothetical protein F5Y03DRAFT_94279 [Xylaria venustula]|nr:hypothetical protein F5Y03DRAFT_94279 [Xylaria venustula]